VIAAESISEDRSRRASANVNPDDSDFVASAVPFPKGKRSPLVAAISKDGGRTWPFRTRLEDDPNGWYCYTAIHFVGDAVLLAYCAGDNKIGGLNRLRIRRIALAALRSD